MHRDLKPANILLSPTGTIKVLDFGLAKVWQTEASGADLTHSPTLTAQMTAAAVVLGWVASRPQPPRTPTRLAVDLPPDHRLSITFSSPLALSPDGSRLVFVASRDGARPRLYLCDLSRFGASSIPGTEGADGRFLMIERSRDETADRLHVVLDWFDELKRLVPTE